MSYPSDLRDKDWDLIKPHFATRKYGNRAIHSRRSLVDGILYRVKTWVSGAYVTEGFSPYGRRFMAIFGASPGLEFWKKCWLTWVAEVFFEERVTLMHKRFVEFSTKITGEFVIQAKRWIVERYKIAWLNWARR